MLVKIKTAKKTKSIKTDLLKSSVLDDCYLCVEGTMTNRLMQPSTRVEYEPKEVVHSDHANIIVQAIEVPCFLYG